MVVGCRGAARGGVPRRRRVPVAGATVGGLVGGGVAAVVGGGGVGVSVRRVGVARTGREGAGLRIGLVRTTGKGAEEVRLPSPWVVAASRGGAVATASAGGFTSATSRDGGGCAVLLPVSALFTLSPSSVGVGRRGRRWRAPSSTTAVPATCGRCRRWRRPHRRPRPLPFFLIFTAAAALRRGERVVGGAVEGAPTLPRRHGHTCGGGGSGGGRLGLL